MAVNLEPDRALLTDGTVVAVRELGAGDVGALLVLHESLPLEDRYLRFFTTSPRQLEDFVSRMATPDDPNHVTVGAFRDGRLLGAASYIVLDVPTQAEVALVVSHAEQAHGVGTLLLERLCSLAVRRGLRRFVADVMTINSRMLHVFTNMGLVWTVTADSDVVHVDLGLEPVDTYLDAVADRELTAEVQSLRAVLKPTSIVVIGASRKETGVGNALLRNLVAGDFAGDLYAVNPHATSVAGVACYASIAEVPDVPELAVLCVPADKVPAAAEQCGRRGVKALVVITAGVTEHPELARGLMTAVCEHGMRVVGPNCLGVSSGEPGVSMNATFARTRTNTGDVGVVTQSGGIAIAVVERLRRIGLGTSNLVSTGDKYDVSGNDLLLWWERDEHTRAVVLYLESFGNPRKFARLARRVARRKPVLAIRSASSEAGQRAAASHTAATATPAITRDALFRQAGITAVDGVAELVDVLAALHGQPLPDGRSVAVLSNAGGLGVLAADACVHNGLEVAELSSATIAALRALLPATASTRNPVDTTAVVDERTFARCLDAVAADPGVDAVIVVTVPTALGDPASGVHPVEGKPVLAVDAGQVAAVESGPVPSYTDPAQAAAVLARLAERAGWLARPAGGDELDGIDLDRARAVVARHLEDDHGDGWLAPDQVVELLSAFGLPVLGGVVTTTAEATASAQRGFGCPVVLKAIAVDLLHKSKGGGVVLDLETPEAAADAFSRFRALFGDRLRGAFVQPMAGRGRELLVGVVNDQEFGPLVVTGLGGIDTDLVDDRAAALAPLSAADADDLLHGFRAAEEVFLDVAEAPVRDVLLRVAKLAELVPEIAELDLNPVIATDERCQVVDARVRIEPASPVDPYLRGLRAKGQE
ncbi:GNAT family N-acetyltransferase [Umezawaea endophytica]|uniref:Bifunctional GNAT family N-acetyltransferase/acetate--CoA ligase family protein n=1 Tax=Umezawaea endophytica TaxID=1654476 RepID=A0A9X3A6E3_9PSEU|nr:bifunctional GNAT family N-acetyltransferase/acetate--CoA ligase family protein [Umezawaea endophytica]MCS7484739.1 bifunctional GNAT family N-acetyltransferase/acetate--CoA ligase family protein [Umezawaea endophytica]